jgi:hypothetical protein
VPVICEAKHWICRSSAFPNWVEFARLMETDYWAVNWALYRKDALESLAWGQWHISEIESGEAFRSALC